MYQCHDLTLFLSFHGPLPNHEPYTYVHICIPYIPYRTLLLTKLPPTSCHLSLTLLATAYCTYCALPIMLYILLILQSFGWVATPLAISTPKM